jgi:hypothetical protein
VRRWRPGLELCGNGPIRGPQAQKATIMSPQPQNDGRATARTRFGIFTGRTRAGRRWAGRAFQTLVAAAALAALGVTAGAGSASAATAQSAAATVTGVTWHQLTPINGWVPGQSQFAGDGIPSWAVRNGVVYLSGSVAQTSGTNNEFAVLPAAARPSRVLYMTVFTWAGTQGFVIVHPNGAIQAWANPYSNAQTLTSLAGISYPAPALATTGLSLENGWQSSDSQWGTGDPSYSVSNGMVYLSGSLHQPAGSNQVFGVLPPAARPARTLYLSVYTYAGTIGLLKIDTSGTMYAYFGGAQQYTSLAGVSFPVASATMTKLALINGWNSAQPTYGTGDPSYSVNNGVVHLSGSLLQPQAGGQMFAILPQAARPTNYLYIKTEVYSGSTANTGTVVITPNGEMYAYSLTASQAQQYTSLAGISYPLGS